MAECSVCGKKRATGNNVSHANNRSRRRFEVNLQNKRYWFEEENRWVRLKISAHGMKVINRRGLAKVIAEIRSRGDKV